MRDDEQAADRRALAVLLLQILSGAPLEALKLTELTARLPRELPSSLRENIGRALAAGATSPDVTPRALAAHLAFDVAWLQAVEPATGSVALARPDFGGAAGAHAGPERGAGEGSGVRGPSTEAVASLESGARGAWEAFPHGPEVATPAAGIGFPAPPPRLPVRSAGRWMRWAFAVAVGIVLVAVGFGGRAFEPGTVVTRDQSAVSGWLGVQVGPLPDRKSALTLQRRLRRIWPSALVTPEAGRYWIQVTTYTRPYNARATVRRLRAQGFPVRTVAQRE
jgi:hypothetical protein